MVYAFSIFTETFSTFAFKIFYLIYTTRKLFSTNFNIFKLT